MGKEGKDIVGMMDFFKIVFLCNRLNIMKSRQFTQSAISSAERIKRDMSMRQSQRYEPCHWSTLPSKEVHDVVDEGPYYFVSLDEEMSPEWNC